MSMRPKELRSLFKQFKDGDLDALEALVASERAHVFDYLMRMTGQLSRSMEVVLEAVNAVTAVADNEEDLRSFLILFYRTSRSFSMDSWNAETSRLENASYASPDSGLTDRAISNAIDFERVIRSLPAKQREVLLLNLRYDFSLEEVGLITGYDQTEAQELLQQARGVLCAALNKSEDKIRDGVSKLLDFPMPDDGNSGTQNLSLVVRDLKKSSKSSPSGFLKLLLGVFFLTLLGLGIWKHQMILEYLQAISRP